MSADGSPPAPPRFAKGGGLRPARGERLLAEYLEAVALDAALEAATFAIAPSFRLPASGSLAGKTLYAEDFGFSDHDALAAIRDAFRAKIAERARAVYAALTGRGYEVPSAELARLAGAVRAEAGGSGTGSREPGTGADGEAGV